MSKAKAPAPSREQYRLRRFKHSNDSRRTSLQKAQAAEPVQIGIEPRVFEQLEAAARKLSEENKAFREALARQKSEFENFRSRAQKEKEQLRETAIEALVAKLLPVIDNFERALEAASASTDPQSLRQGIEMVAGQLMRTLEQEGVEKIQALNAGFDPNEHEALAVEERTDVEDNHVTQVMMPGYRLKGKVVRPAMVKVAKAPAAEPEKAEA